MRYIIVVILLSHGCAYGEDYVSLMFPSEELIAQAYNSVHTYSVFNNIEGSTLTKSGSHYTVYYRSKRTDKYTGGRFDFKRVVMFRLDNGMWVINFGKSGKFIIQQGEVK